MNISNDWVEIPARDLFQRLYWYALSRGPRPEVARMAMSRFEVLARPLFAGTKIVGRAAISTLGTQAEFSTMRSSEVVLCVNGIRAETRPGVVGLIFAKPTRAARDEVVVSVTDEELTRWANEQAHLLNSLEGIKKKDLLGATEELRALGAHHDDLPLGISNGKLVSPKDLRHLADSQDVLYLIELRQIAWFESNDGIIEVRDVETGERIISDCNVVYLDIATSSQLLRTREICTLRPRFLDYNRNASYSEFERRWRHYWWLMCDSALGDAVRIVADKWGTDPVRILTQSDFSRQWESDELRLEIGDFQSGGKIKLAGIRISQAEVRPED